MAETPTASDSNPDNGGGGQPSPGVRPSVGSDGAAFARTGRALAELGRAFLRLGRALRDDLAGRVTSARLKSSAHSAAKPCCGCGRWIIAPRKLRAAEMAARSAAVWSRVSLRRSHTSDKQAADANRRSLANDPGARRGASATCLVLFVVLFSWALSDVPWEEIAEGSLKPVVVLETADGKPLVRQGPIQGPYAAREDFPPIWSMRCSPARTGASLSIQASI